MDAQRQQAVEEKKSAQEAYDSRKNEIKASLSLFCDYIIYIEFILLVSAGCMHGFLSI